MLSCLRIAVACTLLLLGSGSAFGQSADADPAAPCNCPGDAEQLTRYEGELLQQQLEMERLATQVASERAEKARQTTINVTLLSIMLAVLILWLSYSLLLQRRRAHTDYLTGIANRGRAFELGFKWCDRARNSKRPLSIVLFDLDRFKRINDGLGHAAGDRALLEVVKVVQGILPRRNLFARIGGEEFLVILPGVNRERALDVAEDMRAAVAAAGFLHAGKHPVNVTISLGVAELDESADFQLLVNRADEALYVAKNSGRNRVVVASSTAERLAEGKVTVGSRHAPR